MCADSFQYCSQYHNMIRYIGDSKFMISSNHLHIFMRKVYY
jgi:hypothetical protein